jgi:solute carrier family 50 protein (sugar transporter)
VGAPPRARPRLPSSHHHTSSEIMSTAAARAALLALFAGYAHGALLPATPVRVQRPLPPHLRALRVRGGDTTTTMSAVVVAEKVCPALGFLLSNALYCSPVPALRERVKEGSLGSFNPLPSALMVLGTTSWVAYALSVKDPWIAATNVPGAVFAYAQLVFLLPLMRRGRELTQVQGTIIGGVACTCLLWCKLIFGGTSAAVRSQTLGIYATIICIILFASPLSTIATVLQTRSSESILAPLTLSQCANCLLYVLATSRPTPHAAPRGPCASRP